MRRVRSASGRFPARRRSTRDSKEFEAGRLRGPRSSGILVAAPVIPKSLRRDFGREKIDLISNVAAPVIPKSLRRTETNSMKTETQSRSTRDSKEFEAELGLAS